MLKTPILVACGFLALAGCGGSRDKLLADLQSPRPQERALAVKKLAGQGNPEDLVLFTRAAKDVASIVRGEAAEALGKSEDPRVVDLLGELLEDDDEDVQAKAAASLAHIKSDKSKAYLTIQYARRGRSTRIAIVQALKASNVPGAMAQVVAAEAQGIWDRNLRALQEGSAPERVAAAEELGKSGRAEAVNRLTPLSKDSQVILAAAAVRGLGYTGDKRSVPAISMLLAENFPELREAACEALQQLQDPQALPTLKAVALEKSAASPLATTAIAMLPRGAETDQALCDVALGAGEREALTAAREMRDRGGCPLDPILERLTKQREVDAALIAIRGLGPTAAAAGPKLIPYLTANDPATRERALWATIETHEASAAPALQKIYEQELKTIDQIRADWVTAELPKTYAPGFGPAPLDKESSSDEIASAKNQELLKRVEAANQARADASGKLRIQVPPPAEIIDDASEDQLRMLALVLRALGAVKAPGTLQLAQKHVGDPSPTVRAAAYAALAFQGDEGIAAAAHGLLDSDREVQAAAAQALAERGPKGQQKIIEVVPKLPGDRLKLLEPLSHTGAPPESLDALLAVIREGGPDSAYAARILGSMKARGAVDPLIAYLDDPNAVARRDALAALGEIGDPKAGDAVARDLYHDSPDVRAAAAKAMAKVGTDRHHEPLDALKGDYYRAVREAAEAALSHLGAAIAEPHR